MKKTWWLIVWLFLTSTAFSQTATIRYFDDRPERDIPIRMVDDQAYLTASDAGEIFYGAKYWRQETRQLAMHLRDHKYILTVDNPFVIVNDKLWNMGAVSQLHDGQLWVPMQFVVSVVDSQMAEDIFWNSEIGLLALSMPQDEVNVLDIVFSAEYQKTVVTINTSEQMRFRTNKDKPGHLMVIIEGGHADATDFTDPYSHGFVNEVKATNNDDSFVIDFNFNRGAKSYEIQSYDEPPRIEISFLGYDVNEQPAPPELRDRDEADAPADFISDLDLIVIDPGHGGKDPGAVGPSGLEEKDITLDIGIRLAETIERELGVKTFLTREDDTFIPLRKRTEMANNLNADLFISVHCNASPSRSANGTETYFLSLAKTTEARAVAARENASLKYEMPEEAVETMGDLDFILWDLAQYEYLEESSMLADFTQEELGSRLNVTSRRVNQAPFYVLNGAYMPAILVETAFITNKSEERLLNTPKFRQNVADAVTNAVARYKRHYDNKMAQTN